MWILKELMILYAYPVMLEYLNVAHTCLKNQKVPISAQKIAKMGIIQKMSAPEKIISFNMARKGSSDSSNIQSVARIPKNNIHCVQENRKYLFLN